MKIDLVYLWVDGSDPQWRAKHDSYLPDQDVQKDDTQTFCDGRVADNDELKYSLRSVELYAPWINHIFIVTDNQIPEWLDATNEKITIVDHKEILPKEILPTFNSTAIEMGLVNIPNLSEYFLYSNDDMLLQKGVSKEFFFTKSGKVIARVKRDSGFYNSFKRLFSRQEKSQTTCVKMLIKANGMISRDFNRDFSLYAMSHNIDAYLKSSIVECMDRYSDDVEKTLSNRFRSEHDLQRHIFTLYSIVTKRAICKARGLFVHNFIKLPFAKLFVNVDWLMLPMRFKDGLKRVRRMNPSLLCINDGDGVSGSDRIRCTEMLGTLFPNKSKFEK